MPSIGQVFLISAAFFAVVFVIGTWPSERVMPKWFAVTGVALFLIALVSGLIAAVQFMLIGQE
jgi:hypothetical protein